MAVAERCARRRPSPATVASEHGIAASDGMGVEPGRRPPSEARHPTCRTCIVFHEHHGGPLKHFLLTLFLGSLFATVGEFLFCVLVRQSVPDYLFTLAAYPVILALAYGPLRWIERRMPTPRSADLAVYAFAGLVGLAIEWFIIGNSPWANPDANDAGMFAYWATVLAMPRLLLDRRACLRPVRRAAAVAFAAFSAAALTIGLLTPQALRLFVLVWVVVLGYAGMNLFFLWAFVLASRLAPGDRMPAMQPGPA